jgi:hypothetical protein
VENVGADAATAYYSAVMLTDIKNIRERDILHLMVSFTNPTALFPGVPATTGSLTPDYVANPPTPPETLWAVILVATDQGTADVAGDNNIAAVCQFRQDGARLTVPGSDIGWRGPLLSYPVTYDRWTAENTAFVLDLEIDRTDPNIPAQAKASLKSGSLYQFSPWLAHSTVARDTRKPGPVIKDCGAQVRINTGTGAASVNLLAFSITTSAPPPQAGI